LTSVSPYYRERPDAPNGPEDPIRGTTRSVTIRPTIR
jgi:hypothetical protein